jgi:hypothetical protein
MHVAEEQTKAAQDAAISAKRQADFVARQMEMSMAPLLVAEPDEANPITGHRSYHLVKIVSIQKNGEPEPSPDCWICNQSSYPSW